MGKSRDMKLAEIVANSSAKMLREYLAELRRQGRIKGKLTMVLKDGKREVRRPFREA